eukprot:8318241-Karenia_brevis.AAC.1
MSLFRCDKVKKREATLSATLPPSERVRWHAAPWCGPAPSLSQMVLWCGLWGDPQANNPQTIDA